VIAVGASVGNYQVVQKIGQGAMGEVWLATHPVIGKRVALKVIHPELSTNEEMIARFFNEARAVTQIGHDNIVDVQDFGQTPDGDSFIVMELLEGQGLGDRMKAEGVFSVSRATHIGIQMADGLAAAHARGIIHRDLKPDNVILINRGGDPDFVKILDFGLAKLSGPGAMSHKTKTGSLLGTPHYMAPEQAEGKKYDHRVDVYALGCILFQMLTGRVPFPGEGFGEVLVKHLREPPPLLTRLNPAVPPAVEKIILHALAKKPEFRFQSMEEFRTALRDPERFAQKLDASLEGLHNTPHEGLPAAQLDVKMNVPATQLPTLVPPPSAPQKLSEDAPTVQGQAPPEVLAVIAAREAAARMAAGGAPATGGPAKTQAFDVASAPGTQRQQKNTVAQPAVAPKLKAARARKSSRMLVIAISAVAALVLGGGALAFFLIGGNVTLVLESRPSGAEVTRDGAVVGKTPFKLTLPKSSEVVTLGFQREGFMTAVRSVTPSSDQKLDVRLLPKPDDEDDVKPDDKPAPELKPATPPAPKPVAATPAPKPPAPKPVAATPVPKPVAATPPPAPSSPPKPKRPKKKDPDAGSNPMLLQPTF